MVAAVMIAAFAAVTAGCGSGSSTTDVAATSAGGSPSEFITPGKKATNKYAEFGHPADDADREAASGVLTENLKARAQGNWVAQCDTLTQEVIKKIEGPESSGDGARCAASLRQLAEPLPDSQSVRTDTLAGPIDVLMVKGQNAYALYHGKKHRDYAMPMENSQGEWKVGALLTIELPG